MLAGLIRLWLADELAPFGKLVAYRVFEGQAALAIQLDSSASAQRAKDALDGPESIWTSSIEVAPLQAFPDDVAIFAKDHAAGRGGRGYVSKACCT